MSEQAFLIMAVAAMVAVTLLPRTLPLQVNTEHWPDFIAKALEYLPVAIIAAITVTPLLIRNQQLQLDRPEFLAAIPTLLCAYLSRNLFLSVALGVAAYIAISAVL